MKKLNRKGFTLIELLAVITIMGILMLVAIPAVSRTIENTRRDTFANTAKSYIKAMKNAVAADEVYVGDDPISAKGEGYYYYGFQTDTGNSATDLMEQGGKSSWGNSNVKGYIAIHKTVENASADSIAKTKYEYAIFMVDEANRGINALTTESRIKRTTVVTKGDVAGKIAPSGAENIDVFGDTTLSSDNCAAVSIS